MLWGIFLGFPGGSVDKESAFHAGDTGHTGSIPRSDPLEQGMATYLSIHRSLAGYSQGQEESDMTETTEHVEHFWIYSMLKLLIFILMMLYRQVALYSFVTLIIVPLKNVPLSLTQLHSYWSRK